MINVNDIGHVTVSELDAASIDLIGGGAGTIVVEDCIPDGPGGQSAVPTVKED